PGDHEERLATPAHRPRRPVGGEPGLALHHERWAARRHPHHPLRALGHARRRAPPVPVELRRQLGELPRRVRRSRARGPDRRVEQHRRLSAVALDRRGRRHRRRIVQELDAESPALDAGLVLELPEVEHRQHLERHRRARGAVRALRGEGVSRVAEPPVARPAAARRLELDDIQGLALRPHSELPYVSYLFLRVIDRARALAALGAATGAITTAKAVLAPSARRPKTRVQLAFSHTGLAALGLDAVTRASFSPEFQSGMAEPARSRRLGDRGESAPERWELGGSGHRLEVLVALFADTTEARAALVAEWGGRLDGLVVEKQEDSTPRKNQKEHFGFRDGVSQPALRGDPTRAHLAAADRIADGEFLFGYANEYGKLPSAPRTAGGVDLGDNGTYLVFRKLEQHVARFWRYFHIAGGNDAREAERLASKCVGRWPSGAPLVLAPDHDDR